MSFRVNKLLGVAFALPLAIGLFAAGNVSAAEAEASHGPPPAVTESEARKWLLDYHGSLTKQLNKRAYSHLHDEDRVKIVQAQKRIHALIDDVDSVSVLNLDERAELWNEHAVVVAVLQAREDQRLVCERVNKTGTHVDTMECLTVATRARMRQDAETMMRDTRGFVDPPPGAK